MAKLKAIYLHFILFLHIFLFTTTLFSQYNYPLLCEETFNAGCSNWQANFSENWRLGSDELGGNYELIKAGPPATPKKPTSISILTPYVVGNFVLEVVAKCNTDSTNSYRDICLFYAYQDSVHFYYTHFSARSDSKHNITAIVNNADREKINLEEPGETQTVLKDHQYHTFKIIRSIKSGDIDAYFDKEKIITAIDNTFMYGKIGIGSFDDTATFTSVKLWGEKAETKVENTAPSTSGFSLKQNYPNPFNSNTTIRFELTQNLNVKMNIYDINSRFITQLANKSFAAGQHTINWNGRDLNGNMISTGVYIVHAQTYNDVLVNRIVYMQ